MKHICGLPLPLAEDEQVSRDYISLLDVVFGGGGQGMAQVESGRVEAASRACACLGRETEVWLETTAACWAQAL